MSSKQTEAEPREEETSWLDERALTKNADADTLSVVRERVSEMRAERVSWLQERSRKADHKTLSNRICMLGADLVTNDEELDLLSKLCGL